MQNPIKTLKLDLMIDASNVCAMKLTNEVCPENQLLTRHINEWNGPVLLHPNSNHKWLLWMRSYS